MIVDRVHQARVTRALEPEWEARFEPKSYGFRPGRGCHDAIEAIFTTVCGERRTVGGCSTPTWPRRSTGSTTRTLARTSSARSPPRGLIGQWLKAGVVEQVELAPTEEGTPQGGVISPLLLNVALHGMEQAAGVRYRRTGSKQRRQRWRAAPWW